MKKTTLPAAVAARAAALALTCLFFPACQKQLTNEAAADIGPKINSVVIGPLPPPTYVVWSSAGKLPFLDDVPGDVPNADIYPLGFTINGKGYIVGSIMYNSYNSTNTTRQMYEYDLVTRTWTEKASIPAGGSPVYGATFVIGDNAYVFAPDDGMYRYNQPSNTWSVAASLPPGLSRFNATAFAINGKGYIGLGSGINSNNNPIWFTDWWEYNPATNTWTQKADIPGSGEAARGLDGYVNGGLHFGFVITGGVINASNTTPPIICGASYRICLGARVIPALPRS